MERHTAAAAEKRGDEIVVGGRASNSNNNNNSNDNDDNSNSDNKIVRLIPEEHLVSILLMLPIESIMWFGMSCKRLKWLVSESQPLWESLCRRDWAYATSSSWRSCDWKWRQLYQRIRNLDSLSCTLLSPPPPHPTFPLPRASLSLSFLSGSLLLFGGGSDGGHSFFYPFLSSTCVSVCNFSFAQLL